MHYLALCRTEAHLCFRGGISPPPSLYPPLSFFFFFNKNNYEEFKMPFFHNISALRPQQHFGGKECLSPVTVAACLYLKCLAELSPGDMLLSERIIHPPQALPPPAWTLFLPQV